MLVICFTSTFQIAFYLRNHFHMPVSNLDKKYDQSQGRFNSHDDVIKRKHLTALMAICAGNSPVTGEFPAQRPATRSFDVFFYLRLNKRLSKQSWGWWFETLSRPLWRHYNALVSSGLNVPSSYWKRIFVYLTFYFYYLFIYSSIHISIYIKFALWTHIPLWMGPTEWSNVDLFSWVYSFVTIYGYFC